MLVEVNGVSKAFKKVEVLKNIDLSIDRGEIFGLIGPSGTGKTTLIKLIIGAIGADAGEIHIAGRKIPDLAALSGIGYMPQSDALYPDLSGMENILFFGGMYRLSARALKSRAEEVLALVELSGMGARRVSQYSTGMKKRLSLAIALIHDPELLVLDEADRGHRSGLAQENLGTVFCASGRGAHADRDHARHGRGRAVRQAGAPLRGAHHRPWRHAGTDRARGRVH